MLALDIDGVIADTQTSLILYLCDVLDVDPSTLGTPGTDYHDGVRTLFTNASQTRLKKLIRDAYDKGEGGIYDHAHPYPGALDGANWIARRKLLRGYITKRPGTPALKASTAHWLAEHNFPAAPIHHVPQGGQDSKADVMRQVRASIIVEDSPSVIADVLSRDAQVIVMDRPYNRALPMPVLRAESWPALIGILKALPLDYRQKFEKGW